MIVKVNPETLTQLRAVLHQIDAPPVTFEISAFQGDPNWLASQNDNTINISTQSSRQQQKWQSVRVSNGQYAFVSSGQEIPVLRSVGIGWWTGVSYDRRQLQNGFLVEPQLQGNQVRLRIKKVRQEEGIARPEQFNEQNVVTTLMVPLNQWTAVSNAAGQFPKPENGISISAGNKFTQNSTLYIKVSKIR